MTSWTRYTEPTMPVSEVTYRRVALEDPDHAWELRCGNLVEKHPMSMWHNSLMRRLGAEIQRQLPIREFEVATNNARLRNSTGSYFVPDVAVIPATLLTIYSRDSRELEVYEEPLPFVAELWSPSTGDFDLTTKVPEYQLRKDAEIWRLHPHERFVESYRLDASGSYGVIRFTRGRIRLFQLPQVEIDLDELYS